MRKHSYFRIYSSTSATTSTVVAELPAIQRVRTLNHT